MGDDLTDMGISATAAAAMGREQVVLAHHPEHPLAGKHGCHDRPEAEPRPCGVPRPPRGMPPGRPRWPPAEPRPRSRASVPGALLVGAQRWPAAGISWRRTRNGQNPRPHRPAGGRRPNPCRERWRHSSPRPRRPKGPVSVLASSSSTCMINSPIRFMAMSSSAFTGSPLRSLSEASIPAIAFSRHCSSRKISTPNCRDKSSTGSPRKSRRATSRLRVTVHRWPSPSGACRRNLARGKRGRAKLALVYHRLINSNFVLKIVGHVPVLLGHFD